MLDPAMLAQVMQRFRSMPQGDAMGQLPGSTPYGMAGGAMDVLRQRLGGGPNGMPVGSMKPLPSQAPPAARLASMLGSQSRGPMPGNNPAGFGFGSGTMANPRAGAMGRKPIMGRPAKKPTLSTASRGPTVASALGR